MGAVAGRTANRADGLVAAIVRHIGATRILCNPHGYHDENPGFDPRLTVKLKTLPRLLRYVILSDRETSFAAERLIAEITELAPGIPLISVWAEDRDAGSGLALAIELDHRAVADDRPDLRSIADCVRLMCLRRPKPNSSLVKYRRVAKSLLLANSQPANGTDPELAAEIEAFCFGWAALSNAETLLPPFSKAAASDARWLGELIPNPGSRNSGQGYPKSASV